MRSFLGGGGGEWGEKIAYFAVAALKVVPGREDNAACPVDDTECDVTSVRFSCMCHPPYSSSCREMCAL